MSFHVHIKTSCSSQVCQNTVILFTMNMFVCFFREVYLKSSDAKASKCHLKFSSRMIIFIKLVYLSSVISLKGQFIGNLHCHLSEITELKYTSWLKMIILEENFKCHLEAFASELFICSLLIG